MTSRMVVQKIQKNVVKDSSLALQGYRTHGPSHQWSEHLDTCLLSIFDG